MTWPPDTSPNFNPALAAIPTGLTTVDTSDLHLLGVIATNTSGGARALTVTDGNGTVILNAVDIPDTGIPFVIEFPLLPISGFKWMASGANCTGKPWGWK